MPVIENETRSGPPLAAALPERLEALRRELIDQAFVLDRRGDHRAADVAMATAARIGELCGEP